MRILALSDLNWSRAKNGTDLPELLTLVEHVQPELVMLAGDLVDNDKGVNHQRCLPYWRDLGVLLDTLEAERINCCFVRGNWDEIAEYDALAAPQYTYVHEISGTTITIGSLRILGIPNAATTRKTVMRELIASYNEPVDIVLTHADGVRRMRLFELPTQLIITGHFDNKLSIARGKALIAFQNYPGQYAVIDYTPSDILIEYYYGRINAAATPHRVRISAGQAEWITPPMPEWLQYGQHIELLFHTKDVFPTLDTTGKRAALHSLLEHGVYKAHILEYIPGSAAFLP